MKIDVNTYQDLAMDYLVEGTSEAVLIAGLGSECGEVLAEWVKEERVDRSDTDNTAELISELSDVLWYVTALAHQRGVSLEYLMKRNLGKLELRALNG